MSFHRTSKTLVSNENASSLFRSPSIYENERSTNNAKEDENPSSSVMQTYLSGKICPLTPSQKQTDVSHLVFESSAEKKTETTLRPKSLNFDSPAVEERQIGNLDSIQSEAPANSSFTKEYCNIM